MDNALGRYRDLLLWLLPPALLVSAPPRGARRARQARGRGDGIQRHAGAARALGRRDAARCGNSARRSPTSCGHRWPHCAARSSCRCAARAATSDERATLASQIEELDRLARLIDQILTLARAESGQIRLTFAPVDVGELAASLVEQLEPVAQARTIDLRCERNGTVLVNGDAGWLQRLLLNLLDNAIKFTREGGKVVLRVSREAGRARIDVHDTGIGMSAEVTPHVFERFFQADPARSSVDDGAGVGLSLVKWIVDRHEGTIAVHSRVGEGSTFTVRLP